MYVYLTQLSNTMYICIRGSDLDRRKMDTLISMNNDRVKPFISIDLGYNSNQLSLDFHDGDYLTVLALLEQLKKVKDTFDSVVWRTANGK